MTQCLIIHSFIQCLRTSIIAAGTRSTQLSTLHTVKQQRQLSTRLRVLACYCGFTTTFGVGRPAATAAVTTAEAALSDARCSSPGV
jgi:hypothetical protein